MLKILSKKLYMKNCKKFEYEFKNKETKKVKKRRKFYTDLEF